jgi:hypothetical protein
MWDETDDDGSDEEDWSLADEDSPTVLCPECGGEVYEESDHCPECGHFLESLPAHPLLGKPGWFVILGLLGILATLIALSGLP